jgi:predicted lipopolysaccharide heptosyltransferase III
VKILLIRLRLIGDVVFTTPAVAAVRRHFPDAHITYLVETSAAPVLRHNPSIDELIVADRPRGVRRLRYDLALARRLRAGRFDLVIDFHGGPRSAWLTWATRATQRVGYDLPGRGWVYTARLPWSRSLVPPRHSVENQWDLLAPLGIAPPDRVLDAVQIAADSRATQVVESRLHAAGVPPHAPVIVIHVSAGNPFRRWPQDRFADLATSLADGDPQRRIIITAGPSEHEAADRIAADAQQRKPAVADRIIRCGEFDLAELRALVARAALFIGGDSGPLHIASATRTPIVALFGPTLPERSLPWRDPAISSIAVDAGDLPCRPCHQRRCVPGDFRCLTRITPLQVLEASNKALAKGDVSLSTRQET